MKTTHQIAVTDEYIAESQQIVIAQNKALKLVYQTWWFLWLECLVILGAAIAFWLLDRSNFVIPLCIAAFAALPIVSKILLRRNLSKARREVRARGTTSTVSLDANGIDAQGAFGNSHLKWTAVIKTVAYPNGVLLKISRLMVFWLPDQYLVEGTPAEVRQLLADNCTDSSEVEQK